MCYLKANISLDFEYQLDRLLNKKVGYFRDRIQPFKKDTIECYCKFGFTVSKF